MTLVGSQTSSRSWDGCQLVSVVKQANGATVKWGWLSAAEEINFLYTRHVFRQIIENIYVTVHLNFKVTFCKKKIYTLTFICERKSASRYIQERSNSVDVSPASSFITSTEVRKELLPHYFTYRKCRPRSRRRQPDLTTYKHQCQSSSSSSSSSSNQPA